MRAARLPSRRASFLTGCRYLAGTRLARHEQHMARLTPVDCAERIERLHRRGRLLGEFRSAIRRRDTLGGGTQQRRGRINAAPGVILGRKYPKVSERSHAISPYPRQSGELVRQVRMGGLSLIGPDGLANS